LVKFLSLQIGGRLEADDFATDSVQARRQRADALPEALARDVRPKERFGFFVDSRGGAELWRELPKGGVSDTLSRPTFKELDFRDALRSRACVRV
jgi:hypothetical protein